VLTALAPLLGTDTRDAVEEPGVWPWQHVFVDALVGLGRLEEADRELARFEAKAQKRERRAMIGRLARSRAGLAMARGDDELAAHAFTRSAIVLGELSMPLELALTELAHGQYLRRRRQRRAAIEQLARARDRLSALGARPALTHVERELQAAGVTDRSPVPAGPGQLTPQESTVASLVISGMTNREIAGELMLSTKTVEVHLTRLYAKLEVSSRSELRARARRGELSHLSEPA
jgi:DNA-binding CsgD family transcriptional regulator